MVTIRKCQKEEEQAARELITAVFHNEFPGEADNFPADDLTDIHTSYGKLGEAFFVALYDGLVVGTVGIKRDDERTALLRRLFVDPRFRRRNIGNQLIEQAVNFCREVGYDELIFKTTSTMNQAVQLCEKKGFIPRARLSVGPVQLMKFALFLKGEPVKVQRKRASA